jgi:hypothetical protein
MCLLQSVNQISEILSLDKLHFTGIFVYLKIIFLKFDLQIGAGTSLPGITAVKCGANVILSDSSDYPQCLENCRISCEANELSNIPVIGIKWGQFNSDILHLILCKYKKIILII